LSLRDSQPFLLFNAFILADEVLAALDLLIKRLMIHGQNDDGVGETQQQ